MIHDGMTNDEVSEASAALTEWFKSQNIGPLNALMVLSVTLALAISSLVPDDDDGGIAIWRNLVARAVLRGKMADGRSLVE